MEKTFQTGSFSFRLKFPEELVLPVDMEKFLVKTDSADYTYIITAVDILPEAEGELIVDRVDLQVFHTKEGLESRRIGVKGEARPYAFYRETAQNRAEVFVGTAQFIIVRLINAEQKFCLFFNLRKNSCNFRNGRVADLGIFEIAQNCMMTVN